MRDESNKIFLCYAWEDMARVQQIILETEHEIDAKISSGTLMSSSMLDDEISDKIASSELFIVFISDAAKKSDFVIQCVTRASHLNKNILPLEIDKQGLFVSKNPQEFKFRSKTYSYDDGQSKARFFAQLKAALGLNVEEGDAFGALVHIVTDRNAKILRYGNLLGLAQPNTDCKIRLAKGSHQLQFQAAEDMTLFIHKTIDIPDNESEQFIEIPMNRLLQQKQEREENERFQMEMRKQMEREQFKKSLCPDDEAGPESMFGTVSNDESDSDTDFSIVWIVLLIMAAILLIVYVFANTSDSSEAVRYEESPIEYVTVTDDEIATEEEESSTPISDSNSEDNIRQAIQGTYLANVSSMMGGIDEIHQYGKYVITDITFSSYSWDESTNSWSKDFSVPYQLVYNNSDDYLSGYNIVYQSPYSGEARMCVGDLDNDGALDIWCSDFIYHTKQS